MTIKDRVFVLLKERNIKAVRMESDLGLARGYISKLDKSSPNSDKLLSIAQYLDVTMDYLVTGKMSEHKSRNNLTFEEESIIKAYRALNDDQKALVCQMLNIKRDSLLSKEA